MDNLLLESYCPTCEALSIIYETMESDSETFKSFVHTGLLMESGASEDIVMESVSDMFKTIAEGFNKFIKKVKEFFKKILLYITSAYQDLDKVAAQVKDVIKDKDIDFTVNGFKFTVMDKSGPNTTEFRNIVNSYNEDMQNLSKLKESTINKEILEVSGFIFQDNTYSKNGICVSPIDDNRWDVTISTETSNVHTCISYVHELQSLYLMFFNEQLPLKFGELRLIVENGNSQSFN